MEMRRRITVRKRRDGFYNVIGGGKRIRVSTKSRAKEIARARIRLRRKGRR